MRRYLCILLAGLLGLVCGRSLWAQETNANETPAETKTVSADDLAAEWQRIEGLWKPKSAVLAGEKLDAEICKRIRLEFADGKFNSDSNGEKSVGKVTIDPTSSPPGMDLFLEEGADAGKTLKCIYKLENDLLYVAFSVSMDQVRPIEFESNQDNKLLVLEYERTEERLPAR